MLRTYIDWLLDVPWSITTEDRIDPVEARKVLDEDHYDLDKVKERIVEYLAVRKLKGDMKGPILCFVGPPGVGKTSLGQSIARAMSRKFVRISLGGVRDEAEIRGHRRTYIGSIPGRIVQALKQAGRDEPGVHARRDRQDLRSGIRATLPRPCWRCWTRRRTTRSAITISRFRSTCRRSFSSRPRISSGRSIPPCSIGWKIIQLSGYSEEEKVHIARRYLLPASDDRARSDARGDGDHGCRTAAGDLRSTRARRASGTSSGSSGTIARKVAARVATRPVGGAGIEKAVIDRDQVDDYLGPARFKKEVAFRTSRAGVATGLAWTETGGDVLFIEATLLPGGNQNIILTGQLGSVMQESARAALSHIRARAGELGLSPDFLAKQDLHVHVPAGAIPKDGPSAGVTMATAILSAARNEPVRQDVAMTGEITLSGLVLPGRAVSGRRHWRRDGSASRR